MKTSLSLTAIGLCFVFFSPCASASELDDLHTQRIEAHQRAAGLLKTSYRAGQVTIQQVLDANAKLLEAQRDAAKTPEQRVEILKLHLKLTKAAEENAKQFVDAGARPVVDIYLSKAARLRVEILIAKEKQLAADGKD